jgi:hypothetical protein
MARKKYLKLCNALTAKGTKCKNEAGWGTGLSFGRCKWHGGTGARALEATKRRIEATALPMGDYSRHLEDTQIKELAERFRSKVNPTDLLDELAIMRAVVTNRINNAERIKEALLAWHASFDDAYGEDAQLWFLRVRDISSELEVLKADEDWENYNIQLAALESLMQQQPLPENYMKKPREIQGLDHVPKLLQQIGAMVERVHKIEQDGAVTINVLLGVLNQVGEKAVHAARESIESDTERAAFITAFRLGVAAIPLMATGSPVGHRQSQLD